MSFLDPLAKQGGPLTERARRFLETRGGADAFPHGPHGARQLATFIEELDDDADTNAFVEGAGALLAMLLISAQREARHDVRGTTHRLRLGRYGFFDPFGAIEAALDAESPRAALAAAIREAEAEARGEGATSRVVLAIEAQLLAIEPTRRIAYAFEHHLELDDGIELDIARLVATTRGESDEVLQRNVRKLIELLPGSNAAAGLGRDELTERALPRLVGDRFFAQLGDAGGKLCTLPIAPGIAVGFILQFEGRARYVRGAELENVPARELFEIALGNLRARSERTLVVDDGDVIAVRNGDGLDAARVLLPELRGALEDRLHGELAIGVPHRDALYACAAAQDARAAALATRVADEHARAPHPICGHVLRSGAFR